eukprot:scaffold1746_cov121-Isochrysis_galbana.AAC.8
MYSTYLGNATAYTVYICTAVSSAIYRLPASCASRKIPCFCIGARRKDKHVLSMPMSACGYVGMRMWLVLRLRLASVFIVKYEGLRRAFPSSRPHLGFHIGGLIECDPPSRFGWIRGFRMAFGLSDCGGASLNTGRWHFSRGHTCGCGG